MKRVLIVGGGISGLITNYVLKQHRGLDVKVLEPGAPGGEFTAGGLKYIHRTDEVVAMFGDLGIAYSKHNMAGGILLQGRVRPYPRVLSSLKKGQSERLRADHFRKTRRQEPGDFGARSMNDPEDVDRRSALRCDFPELIERLAARCEFVKARLDRIEPKFVTTNGGGTIWYDYLVLTIPLWVIRQCAYFPLPEGVAMRLNVANVSVYSDPYPKWDYVYTPYTPCDAIHRISQSGGLYSCEMNGELDGNRLAGDLNFLFKSGWAMASLKEGLKGHLLPLPEVPEWPEHILPVGRFSKWDPRSTADVVVDDAFALASSWGFARQES